MNRNMLCLVAIVLALACVPAMAQGDGKSSGQGTNPPHQLPQVGPSYVIGAEDQLSISVWKEPDLTQTLPVRADGMISLPLLNDVQAAGLTPMQLSASITEKLKKYIADPHVTVTVTQMNSQRVYVTGEVLHAGAMNLTPGMTVLQALASAGFSQFANTKKIYVLRNENGAEKKYPVDYKKIVKGEAPQQNIQLRPGDTVVVPKGAYAEIRLQTLQVLVGADAGCGFKHVVVCARYSAGHVGPRTERERRASGRYRPGYYQPSGGQSATFWA
jgi:polysaccharide export outer membrane protein